MVIVTFAVAIGAATVVSHLNGDEVLAGVLGNLWIFWSAVFLVAIISIVILLSHLYPKKEY
jgi:hypothetical protein